MFDGSRLLFGSSLVAHSEISGRSLLPTTYLSSIDLWTGAPEKVSTPLYHRSAGLPSGPRMVSSQSVASCGCGAFGKTKPLTWPTNVRGLSVFFGCGGIAPAMLAVPQIFLAPRIQECESRPAKTLPLSHRVVSLPNVSLVMSPFLNQRLYMLMIS